jgi:hypothetical protein
MTQLIFGICVKSPCHNRLKVFRNRVPRGISRTKRDEIAGGWRNPHKEELHNLDFLPNTIRTIRSRSIRCSGHVARVGEKRNAYRILAVTPEGKRPLGRPRCR